MEIYINAKVKLAENKDALFLILNLNSFEKGWLFKRKQSKESVLVLLYNPSLDGRFGTNIQKMEYFLSDTVKLKSEVYRMSKKKGMELISNYRNSQQKSGNANSLNSLIKSSNKNLKHSFSFKFEVDDNIKLSELED